MQSLFIGFIMLGIFICLIPLIKGIRHPVNSLLLTLNSFIFSGFAIFYIILSYCISKEFIPLFSITAFYAIISISIKTYLYSYKLENLKDLTRKQRIRLVKVPLIISSFLLISLTAYSSMKYYSGTLFLGQSSQGDKFGQVYFSIIGTPLMSMMAILVCLGGLVKVVTVGRAANYVSNILIVILPVLIFIMVLIGVIPMPKELNKIFMGKTAFIFIYLLITVSLIMIMFVFQNVKLLQI